MKIPRRSCKAYKTCLRDGGTEASCAHFKPKRRCRLPANLGRATVRAERVKQILCDAGLNVTEFRRIGGGTQGDVYAISPTRVVKTTDDPREMAAAGHLRGKQTRHLVHVFDIVPVAGTKDSLIVQERLEPLSQSDRRAYFEAQLKMPEGAGGMGRVLQKAKSWAAAVNTWRTQAKTPAQKLALDQALTTFERLDIPAMHRELTTQGIKYQDWEPDNILRRDGTYVLTDMGRTRFRTRNH